MRRFFLGLSAIALILLLSGYLLYRNADTLLEKIISKKTGLETTVGSLAFQSQEIVLSDFRIANPKEATLPTALRVATLSVKAPYGNYLSQPIAIEEIHLDEIYVNVQLYDQTQTRGNWQTLIRIMNAQEQRANAFSIKREITIRKLLLTTIRVELILADGSRQMLSPIKELVFYDISSSEGIPMQKIMQAIVQHMIRSIFLQKGLKSLFQIPETFLRGIFTPFSFKTNFLEPFAKTSRDRVCCNQKNGSGI